MRVSLNNLGQYGVIIDLLPHELPLLRYKW